jgi:tetratricopeptide (TPR) repeat protein
MGIEEILEKIHHLRQQGYTYHVQGQHTLALQQYQQAIKLAVPLGDGQLLAYLLRCAASEHRDCDNYHHAVDLLLKALFILQFAGEAIELRASIKKLLAITFKDIFGPQKPEVLQLLQEARDDYVQLGNVGQEANILQHIGGAYVQLDLLAEADGILTDAFNKATQAKDAQLQGWILDALAELEIERSEWGLALDYTRKAREKVRTVEDTEGEGDTWITEARILVRMGHIEEALEAAQQALKLYTANKNLRRSIRARRHVAKILGKQGEIEESLDVLQEALKTAKRLELHHDQVLLYLQLGRGELMRKNIDRAIEYGKQALALAESEGLSRLMFEANELMKRCHSRK